jgi:hypothetical protein
MGRELMQILIPILIIFSSIAGKNLTLHGRYDPQNRELLDIKFSGNTMIITGNLNGTEFYDISDSLNPVHLANLEIPFGNQNRALPNFIAAITDTILYLSSRQRGIATVNISDPSNPQYIAMVTQPAGSNYSYDGLTVHDSTLYASAHEHGVILFNISSPESPTYFGQIPAENAWGTVFFDSLLIIMNGEFGLKIMDITDLFNPVTITDIPTAGTTKDLALDEDHLIVAMGSNGIARYDLSDPYNPQLLDTYNSAGFANRIVQFDGKIAVSEWLDVKILEYNGSEIELVGYKNTGYRTMAINAKGNVIYSGEWRHLQVMEFGTISGPDLDLSSHDINFPEINIGEQDTMPIYLTNNGNAVLVFDYDYFSHADFSTSTELSTLAAGDSIVVDIVYTKSGQNASGVYNIPSNDPDESQLSCNILGNYDGVNVGTTAPDFTLPIAVNGMGNFNLNQHWEIAGEIVVIAFFSPG